jgi:hypothetical protein
MDRLLAPFAGGLPPFAEKGGCASPTFRILTMEGTTRHAIQLF